MATGKTFRWKFIIDGDAETGAKALKKVRVETDQLEKSEKKATGTKKELGRTTDGLVKSLQRLAGPATLALLVHQFAQITEKTELMRGQLVTMTGDQEKAAKAFDLLNRFAGQTPFTLDQSIQGFVKLTALGLTPSERALSSYGNTASAMGKDLSQMIEAVADASTMEFERLKEFGIKARQQADTVSFTFQGVTTTVGKNADEIEAFLMGIGENKFGDAMANQMERIPGLVSNLKDSWDNMFRAIGDSGGTDLYATVLATMTQVLQTITATVSGTNEAVNKAFAEVMKWIHGMSRALETDFIIMRDAGAAVSESLKTAFSVAAAVVESVWTGTINTLTNLYADWIDFVAGALDKIPGVDGFADDMRRTAQGLRAQVDEAGNLESRLEEIFTSANAASEERREKSAAEREALDRAYEAKIRLADLVIEVGEREVDLTLLQTEALEDLVSTREDDEGAAGGQITAAGTLIEEMAEELRLMGLSTDEREFARRTRNLATEATDEEAEAIRRLIGDIRAETDAEKALQAQLKATEKVRQNQIENVQRGLGEMISTVLDDGKLDFESFFGFIIDGWKKTVAEMAAADITNAIFNGSSLLSGGSGGSGGSSIMGLLSGGSSLLGASGIGGFIQGAAGIGQGAAGFVGPMTQSATMGANFTSFMTGPVGMAAAAALAAKLIHDYTSDPDGFKNSNAGMLVAPTAGAAGSNRTFNVNPFLSGFSPTGYSAHTSQAEATEIINIFRSLDSRIVELVRTMDGAIDLSKATLSGVNTFGQAGSSGTFLGIGGKTENFDSQLNQFAEDLVRHITGLSDSTMEKLTTAGSAEQIIEILTEAVDDLGLSAGDGASKAERLAEAERALSNTRAQTFATVGALITDLLSQSRGAGALRTVIQADINSALGATNITRPSMGGDHAEQIANISLLRQAIVDGYQEELAREKELHDAKVRHYNDQIALSKRLGQTVTSLLTGNLSPLSTAGRFDVAMADFQRLAGLAEGGDIDAAGQVGGAAETAIRLTRDMFASSSQSKDITNSILERLVGIQEQFGAATGPGAFNASGTGQMVQQLQTLDRQLIKIQAELYEIAAEEALKMGLLFEELPLNIANALRELMGLAPSGGGVDREGFNPIATPDLIRDYADQVLDGGPVTTDKIKEYVETAIAHGVPAAQTADALGISVEEVQNLARSAGIEYLAEGGIVNGPTLAMIGEGSRSEAVIPLPNNYNASDPLGSSGVVAELVQLNQKQSAQNDALEKLSDQVATLNKITMTAAETQSDQAEASAGYLEEIAGQGQGGGVGSQNHA